MVNELKLKVAEAIQDDVIEMQSISRTPKIPKEFFSVNKGSEKQSFSGLCLHVKGVYRWL